MQNKEQVYSMAGHAYYPYEYLMSNLRECHNIGESVEVWEADKVEWKHSDFVDVDDLIENMQSQAMDECGEVAEEYLNELTNDQKSDLYRHISLWFMQHSKINFYGVENEKKIVVIVE